MMNNFDWYNLVFIGLIINYVVKMEYQSQSDNDIMSLWSLSLKRNGLSLRWIKMHLWMILLMNID